MVQTDRHLRSRAAASEAVLSGSVPLRRRPDSNVEKLEQLSCRLQDLTEKVRRGARSWREHDNHIDEAESVAAELRAVFRGRAENPPLMEKQVANGRSQAAW